MSTIEISVAPEAPVSTPVTTREVLHRAADLLEEFGWCQRSAGLTEDGVAADLWAVIHGGPCVAYCHNGAIFRAALDLGGFPVPESIATFEDVHFNDKPGRTKAEVVARLREAAENAA